MGDIMGYIGVVFFAIALFIPTRWYSHFIFAIGIGLVGLGENDPYLCGTGLWLSGLGWGMGLMALVALHKEQHKKTWRWLTEANPEE